MADIMIRRVLQICTKVESQWFRPFTASTMRSL